MVYLISCEGGMESMPKGSNQKFKLYRLAQIMLERTDEGHYISMPEIMAALSEYDVTADRKSIYNDLRDLSVFGIEVEGEPIGNRYHYHVNIYPIDYSIHYVDIVEKWKIYYCIDRSVYDVQWRL